MRVTSVQTPNSRAQSSRWREKSVPQRYPSCVVFGRGRSRQSGEGSCVGGTAIRTCHSGIGRSCCLHGCRACPVHQTVSILFNHCVPSHSNAASPHCSFIHRLSQEGKIFGGRSYLSGVDSRAGEGIFVGTHVDCCVGIRRLCWLSIKVLPRSSLWVEGVLSLVESSQL